MMPFEIGDKVKLNREYLKPVYVELTTYPANAAAINGVSDKDELFVKGYVLRSDLTYDGRVKKAKSFIVHKDRIQKID